MKRGTDRALTVDADEFGDAWLDAHGAPQAKAARVARAVEYWQGKLGSRCRVRRALKTSGGQLASRSDGERKEPERGDNDSW